MVRIVVLGIPYAHPEYNDNWKKNKTKGLLLLHSPQPARQDLDDPLGYFGAVCEQFK